MRTEFYFEKKVCTKGFRKQEKQVKKMMEKQGTMGMRAHCVCMLKLFSKIYHDIWQQCYHKN